MESSDSLLRFPACHPESDLHHQRHREYQCPAAQDHQDPGVFPNDDAATKLIWMGLRNITANWGSAAQDR